MRIFRFIKILITLTRFGLDEVILSRVRDRRFTFLLKITSFGRKYRQPAPLRLRLALESLGPIFVKFGQMLSTRGDLLPADFIQELSKLQDNVEPFATEQAIKIIEQSLGLPLHTVFSDFDLQPLGSASVAQVYFAKLNVGKNQGKAVAIKVLRPNIMSVIDNDMGLLKHFAAWGERWWVDGRRLRLREVVSEFDKYLHDELDLIKEGANASQLRENFSNSQLLCVPEIYWDYISTNVLVMERMQGVPINHIDALRKVGVDLKKLAQQGVEIFFTQVFRDGFFHADMHPGNIFVGVTPDRFARYIALDFGIIGTLSDFDKNYLAQNFLAFFRRDYHQVAVLHVESGWVPRNTRVDELESAVRAVCEPYFDRPLKDISLGMVLMRLFAASRRFNMEIQPQLVLLQKTMLNIEALGRTLDPDLDLWQTAKPFLEKWMREQVGLKGWIERLKFEVPQWNRMLPQIPRLVYQNLLKSTQSDERDQNPLLMRLLEAQKRTNDLLISGLILGVVGLTAYILLHFNLI